MADLIDEPEEGGSGGTAGGKALRALRKQARRTQLWVEAEAELGTGYLQRIETGKILHPERSTIERILDALDARFGERRELLERFGYIVTIDPPTDRDRAWAAEICAGEIEQLPFPAYAIDCVFRVIAFNPHMAALFGREGARVMRRVRAGQVAHEGEMLEQWFTPTSPIGRAVAEPDRLLPAMIRAVRYEMQQLGDAPWQREVVSGIAARQPRFRHYWKASRQEAGPVLSARALVPVKLITPDGITRAFRLSTQPFSRDPRFRIVYFFPADLSAMQWCEAVTTNPEVTEPVP